MIATCDCPNGMAPCGHPITQEDMLCDQCRRGECRALGQPLPTAEQRAAVAEMKERAEKFLETTKYGTITSVTLYTAPVGGEIIVVEPT